MSFIKFTFIVPLYNKDNVMIQRCLESIPMSDDVQIIVVDDHSPSYYDDNDKLKKDVLNQLPLYNHSCVEYFFLEKNGGPGIARNFGINMAKGEWILFLDADDYYDTNLLNELMDYSLKSSAELILFANHHRGSEKSYVDMYGCKNEGNEDFYVISGKDDQRFVMVMYPWARMMRKSLIERIDARFEEMYLSEDRLFCVKTFLAAKEKVFYTKPVYNYIYVPNSLSHIVHKKNRLLPAINVAIDVNRIYKDNGFLGIIYDDTLWIYLKELYEQSFLWYWFNLLKVYVVFDKKTFMKVRENVCDLRKVHYNIISQWKYFIYELIKK